MIKNDAPKRTTTDLHKVLENNFRALALAKADSALIEQYSRLLSLLKRYGLDGLEQRSKKSEKRSIHDEPRRYLPDNLSLIPLEQLLSLVSNEEVPRKDLERIATDRFGVPRGSMRSFSNRRMLVDKLRALIRNEQAHATISDLAKRN